MYDIIGDIHGCYEELLQLIERLGYMKHETIYTHPDNRKLVFVGDLTDRGPESVRCMQFVIDHVKHDMAYYVPGNHCDKLYRLFQGRNVQIMHGLETTVSELSKLSQDTKQQLKSDFIKLVEKSPYYATLDDGKLIVTHAGISENLIGKNNKQVRTFCLYGDVTGEKDPDGFPVRRDWAQNYEGDRWIVYGHTPVKKPRMVNRTVNIDTGCVFGGFLTALRYPEFEYEQVASSMPYVAEKFRID